MPKCTFIISAYDQPDELMLALLSLKVQTEPDWEAIVCDNSKRVKNSAAVSLINDPRVRIEWTGKKCTNCFQSANLVVPKATGKYLCFPSCDNYYVPQFLELMLAHDPADLIYCDMLHDPRGGNGEYRVWNVKPKISCIDKCGFLLKRELFQPFPWQLGQEGPTAADGMLVETLVKSGVKTAKAPGVLWVHN